MTYLRRYLLHFDSLKDTVDTTGDDTIESTKLSNCRKEELENEEV